MYQVNPQSKNPQSRIEAYLKLRQLAFKTSPTNFGITVSPDSNEPFGILMDLSLPQGNAAIVAFVSGDASFYSSAGGGVVIMFRFRPFVEIVNKTQAPLL